MGSQDQHRDKPLPDMKLPIIKLVKAGSETDEKPTQTVEKTAS